jgi:hypothetical protein
MYLCLAGESVLVLFDPMLRWEHIFVQNSQNEYTFWNLPIEDYVFALFHAAQVRFHQFAFAAEQRIICEEFTEDSICSMYRSACSSLHVRRV